MWTFFDEDLDDSAAPSLLEQLWPPYTYSPPALPTQSVTEAYVPSEEETLTPLSFPRRACRSNSGVTCGAVFNLQAAPPLGPFPITRMGFRPLVGLFVSLCGSAHCFAAFRLGLLVTPLHPRGFSWTFM